MRAAFISIRGPWAVHGTNRRVNLTANGCANHPERDAIAICVVCRRAVCETCSTKVDGIHHCTDCLRAAAERERSTAVGWWGRLGGGERAASSRAGSTWGELAVLAVWTVLLVALSTGALSLVFWR